jgi:ketosteroid isomerase-like protein
MLGVYAVLAPVARAQDTSDPAEQDVREVVNSFKAALRGGDSTTVVHLLHADARIYEGGHAETREQYRSGHLRGDIAFLQGVQSETTWDQVVVKNELAVYMSEYHTTGESRGREIDSHGTETIVLVSTSDGWRIRHIHWSSR